MTLLDAKQYDPSHDRRRNIRIVTIIIVLAVVAGLAWNYRNLAQERIANQFFQDLQDKNYEDAYAVWMHDPNWKQHPEKYSQYTFGEFYRDWGPGGEWGLIKSHRIYGSLNPKNASGVIVEVVVNERAEHARVWVEKSDKTMSFSPD